LELEVSKPAPKTVLNKQEKALALRYWEIIANRLSKAGWSWGCLATLDRKLMAFLELESAICACGDCA